MRGNAQRMWAIQEYDEALTKSEGRERVAWEKMALCIGIIEASEQVNTKLLAMKLRQALYPESERTADA